MHLDKEGDGNSDKLYLYLLQEATEEELERLMDKIMVLFRFIHGNVCVLFLSEMVKIRIQYMYSYMLVSDFKNYIKVYVS